MEISWKDLYGIFLNSKEHYEYSDKCIREVHQQQEGGYIDVAKKAGIEISREKCIPNQKWHMLVSYIRDDRKDDKTSCMKSISRVICPELLIWMAEALDMDITLIQDFFNTCARSWVYENGKFHIDSKMRTIYFSKLSKFRKEIISEIIKKIN